MIALFALGSAPLWLPYAVHALTLLSRATRLRPTPARAVLLCGAACASLFVGMYAQHTQFHSGLGLEADRFPVAAVAAMRSSGRVHRVYNAYNFGGYLMFAGVPKEGVFVDGRAITLYPANFLGEFNAAYAQPARFDALAKHYACDGVLLPTMSPVAAALRSHLRDDARWRLTFHDSVAELYERDARATGTF